MSFDIKKTGDWEQVLALSKGMASDIKKAQYIALGKVAARAEAMAVKFIRDQNLPWKKLSDKYLARKEREGLSSKIYVATSLYFQSITSTVNPQATKAWAGISRKAKNKDGQYVSDIAKVLEYGSIKRGIPPRKLWSVVYRDMRKFIRTSKVFQLEALNTMVKRTGGKGIKR